MCVQDLGSPLLEPFHWGQQHSHGPPKDHHYYWLAHINQAQTDLKLSEICQLLLLLYYQFF